MSVNSIAEGTVVARNNFSFRSVLLCTLPLLALLLWIMALSSLATAGGTATLNSQPACRCRSRRRRKAPASLCWK